MATNDRRVVAMPLADGRLVVVDDPEVRLRPATAQPWAQTAGPLITAALGLRSRDSAGLFELSPASQNALAHLQRNEVDGYFRGVLRTCDGRTAHQLQLRPAADQRTAPSLRPVDAAMLSQLAAIQAQLHRIEQAVQDVALDVRSVLSFLEEGQRAEIAAALDIVGDVHRRQQECGQVAESDWYRLAGVELVLRKQHQQVAEELSRRLSSSMWTGNPKGDARAMKELKPARVAELLNMLRLLAGGLWRWEENVLIHRLMTERVGESDLDAQERGLKSLDVAHTSVVTAVAEVEGRAARTRPRSSWSRLFSDGLVLGSHNDEKDLRSVAEGRKVLRRLTAPTAPEPAPALAARPALELVAA